MTADVVSEDGKESYKNILVNGKPPKVRRREDRLVVDRRIFERHAGCLVAAHPRRLPQQTVDHDREPCRLAPLRFLGRSRKTRIGSVIRLRILTPRSTPARSGSTGRLRACCAIELSAQNMPRTFPLDTVESAVDYDFVSIGEKQVPAAGTLRGSELRARHQGVQPERDRFPQLPEVQRRHQHHIRRFSQ